MVVDTKIMITLDSLVDVRKSLYKELGITKEEYVYRVLENEDVYNTLIKRDKSFLFKDGLGETNLNRLIALLVGNVKTFALTENKEPILSCFINIYPYRMNSVEMEKLKIAYMMKFKTFNNMTIISEPPEINTLSSYDLIVDYNGLYNINEAVSELIDSSPEEIRNKLTRLNQVVMYVPALLFDKGNLTELLKQNDDIEHFFVCMMKEYAPIIKLEIVDLNFFNNTSDIVEEKKEKG